MVTARREIFELTDLHAIGRGRDTPGLSVKIYNANEFDDHDRDRVADLLMNNIGSEFQRLPPKALLALNGLTLWNFYHPIAEYKKKAGIELMYENNLVVGQVPTYEGTSGVRFHYYPSAKSENLKHMKQIVEEVVSKSGGRFAIAVSSEQFTLDQIQSHFTSLNLILHKDKEDRRIRWVRVNRSYLDAASYEANRDNLKLDNLPDDIQSEIILLEKDKHGSQILTLLNRVSKFHSFKEDLMDDEWNKWYGFVDRQGKVVAVAGQRRPVKTTKFGHIVPITELAVSSDHLRQGLAKRLRVHNYNELFAGNPDALAIADTSETEFHRNIVIPFEEPFGYKKAGDLFWLIGDWKMQGQVKVA